MKKYLLIVVVMLAPLSLYAATCSTTSTYKSGTDYEASGCGAYNNKLYFAAGGSVRSCNTCSSGYTRYQKTVNHSSGCTYNMYDCAANSSYAYVVSTCSGTLPSAYADACAMADTGNFAAGAGSDAIVGTAGLSLTDYNACGVYTIRNAVKEDPTKVILCFRESIYANGAVIYGSQMASKLAGCSSNHHGDDYTTYYIDTNWGGGTGSTITISNYARFECCNSLDCDGYTPTTFAASPALLLYNARQCTDTGNCTTTQAGGYVTCAANYYSSTGRKSYTITSVSVNPQIVGSSTLSCKSCADTTGNAAALSAVGSTDITQCYLPANYSESDTLGTWEFRNSCNYED